MRAAEARNELYKRNAQQYIAGRQQTLAEERRQQSERQLGIEESLLGTDEQVAGNLGGVSAELQPYLARYTFDKNAETLKRDGLNASFTIKKANLQGRTDTANALLQQAEDAARGGNFTLAEQLKDQARQSLTANPKGFGVMAGMEGLESIWSLVQDPAMAARTRLASPQALLVGRQLQEARQFSDFNSEASVNERKLMSASGERAIAAGARDAARANRLGATSTGGAQSAYGRQLADERFSRQAGQDKAQLFAGVANQFQQMQRAYGKDTVKFAEDWLQNNSGIRDNFQGALDQLKQNFSQLSTQFAQMHQDMAQFQFQRADAEQARSDARRAYYRDLIVGVTGMAIGGAQTSQALTSAVNGGGGGGAPGGGGGANAASLQALMSAIGG